MQACLAAAGQLQAAGVTPEALAEYVPTGRRMLVFPRAATMHPLGEAWRLGTLLLGTDGTLYAVGRATRAAERGRPGYQSASREERRDLAAAALRGGYPEGTPVNFDARPLRFEDVVGRQDPLRGESLSADADRAVTDTSVVSESPVGLYMGELRVRWRPGAALAGAQTLEAYLAERVELLINPPLSTT